MKIILDKIDRLIVAVIILMMALNNLQAQVYPVNAQINVVQPLGVSLSELQQSTTPKIQVALLLTDLNKPLYSVRLRIIIEGKNLLIKTSQNAVFPPIQLIPGQPVLIDHLGLQSYFSIRNLDIEGLDKAKFQTDGMRLPEGFYNICVEVLDYNQPNSLPVSNTACSQVQMIEYDPPLLMAPSFQNNLLFGEQPPVFQQALFTWQPLHFGFFPVEYQLDIYQGIPGLDMLPGGAIMQYTAPYIRIKTSQTFYNLTPLDPPLLHNQDYYAVVRVIPINYPAIFKNNGKSQNITFNLSQDAGNTCSAPMEYNGTIDREGIILKWKTYQQCSQYITEYYDESDQVRHYQIADIGVGDKLTDTIHQVLSNRYYVSRTGCCCGSDTLYSDTIRLKFNRPHAQVPAFECGIPRDTMSTIMAMLPELHKDDTIVAADFEVIVRRVIGTNGIFSGEGHIVVPLVEYARFNIIFKDIRVNDEYRMVGGQMHVIGMGQNIIDDEWLDFIDSLNSVLEDVSNALGDKIEKLDSLASMQDYLRGNGPNWLVDSIKTVEAALAKATDPDEIKRLEEMLQALLNQSMEWELMYVNLIIECVEYLDSVYQSRNSEITSNYQTSLSVITNQPFYDSPEPDDTISLSDFEEIKVPWEEFKHSNPEMALKVEINFKQELEYTLKLILSSLTTELDLEQDKTYQLLILFNKVGRNVIPDFRSEFESRGWDKQVILDDYDIIPILSEHVKDALTKIYYKI